MNKRWQWFKSQFSKPQTYLKYREYPIFAELSSYDLYLLNDRMHERKFKASEVLFERGYPLEVIYFIHSGDIEQKGMYSSDQERSLSYPQQLGLLDMFHGKKRTSTAIAKTEVSVDAISSSELMDFIQARPRTGLKILRAVCKEFTDLIFEKA